MKDVENKISEKLELKVDLVTEGALTNDRIKRSIEKDLKYIYTV